MIIFKALKMVWAKNSREGAKRAMACERMFLTVNIDKPDKGDILVANNHNGFS